MSIFPDTVPNVNNKSNSKLPVEELKSKQWEDAIQKLLSRSDVWGLSVADLAQDYRFIVSQVGGKNLELPGRMLVVCSQLLRTKAEKLEGGKNGNGSEEEEPEFGGEDFFDYAEFGEETFLPPLQLPVKRTHHRITARKELKRARKSAIEVFHRRMERREEASAEGTSSWLGMDFPEEDIRSKLNSLWNLIKRKLKKGTSVLFSDLLKENDKEEKLEKFIQLLHLQSEGKISCDQKDPFGKIEIQEAKENQ